MPLRSFGVELLVVPSPRPGNDLLARKPLGTFLFGSGHDTIRIYQKNLAKTACAADAVHLVGIKIAAPQLVVSQKKRNGIAPAPLGPSFLARRLRGFVESFYYRISFAGEKNKAQARSYCGTLP